MTEKWKLIEVMESSGYSYFAPDGFVLKIHAIDIIHHLYPNANIRVAKKWEEPFELIRLLLDDGWEPFASWGRGCFCLRKRIEG